MEQEENTQEVPSSDQPPVNPDPVAPEGSEPASAAPENQGSAPPEEQKEAAKEASQNPESSPAAEHNDDKPSEEPSPEAAASGEPPAEGNPEEPKSPTDVRENSEVSAAEKSVDGKLNDEVLESGADKTHIKHDNSGIIEWIKDYLDSGALNRYDNEMWTEDISQGLMTFIENESVKKAFFWVESVGLQLSTFEPPSLGASSFDSSFVYFLKVGPGPITEDNIESSLYKGSMRPHDELKVLQKIISSQVLPTFLGDPTWPDNMKKEFLSEVHSFMAQFTESISMYEEKTMLYVPNEELEVNAKDKKDLLARLENTLMHWTKQIKEVLSSSSSLKKWDNAGPLDEITRWSSRKENLSNIRDQLDKPQVQKIINVLRAENPGSLKGFQELMKQIIDGSGEAEDNLKFLNSLYNPCRQLGEATPSEIPMILPKILFCVRMIKEKSTYYTSEDKIINLLQQISNEIIKRCKASISLHDLLDGDVDKCNAQLDDSIKCGEEWKSICNQHMKCMGFTGKDGMGKTNDIFTLIGQFKNRCDDLKKICEAQVQFSRKGKNSELPCFGGSKGPEIIGVFEEIETEFQKYLDRIRAMNNANSDEILNIKGTRWHDEYSMFSIGIKNLENMFTNLITLSFESATTLEQSVELIEAFDSMAVNERIKTHVEKKVDRICDIFIEELRKAENAAKTDVFIPLHQGKYGGKAVFVKSLINRIEKMNSVVETLKFFDQKLLERAFAEFHRVHKSLNSIIESEHYQKLRKEIKDVEENPGRLLKNLILIYSNEVVLPPWFDSSSLHPLLEKSKGTKTTAPLEITQSESKTVAKVAPHDSTNKHPEAKGEVKHEPVVEKALPRGKDDGIRHIEANFDKTLQKAIVELVTWKKQITDQIPSFPGPIDDVVNIQRETLRVAQEYVMVAVREFNNLLDLMSPIEKKLFDQHLKEIVSSLKRGLKGFGTLTWNVLGSLDNFVKEVKNRCDTVRDKQLELFTQSEMFIQDRLRRISRLKFIIFDVRKVQSLDEFKAKQETNRTELQRVLREIFYDIRTTLFNVYNKAFFDKSVEVQRAWFEHVQQVDEKIEKELVVAVKSSFTEFHRATSSDPKKKKNPAQVLKVNITLEQNRDMEYEVMFSPSTDEIKQFIDNLSVDSINVLSHQDFRPMVEAMVDERNRKIEEIISVEKEGAKMPSQARKRLQDYELPEDLISSFKTTRDFKAKMTSQVAEIFTELKDKISNHCSKLNDQLSVWKKKHEENTGSDHPQLMISYFEDLKLPVENIRSGIEHFDHSQTEIQDLNTSEETICIQADTTEIKRQLGEAIFSNQKKTLDFIKQKCIDELDNIYKDFREAQIVLEVTPQDLKPLKTSIEEHKKYQKRVEQIKESKMPLEEKFKVLDDNLIVFNEEELLKRKELNVKFEEFQAFLTKVKERNDEWYSKLHKVQDDKLVDFEKDVRENKERFSREAPYSDVDQESVEAAFLKLRAAKELTQEFRKKEKDMSFGFNLFNIDHTEIPELKHLEVEIENLEMAWKMKEKWMKKWDELKGITFKSVTKEKRKELVKISDVFLEEISGWAKPIKSWDLVRNLVGRIQHFKAHMPILKLLKNTAMRKRHWDRIQESVKAQFDENSPLFTLERFIEIGFDKVVDNIKEQWEVAQAEFKIETAKNEIQEKYETLGLKLDKKEDADIKFISAESHKLITSNLETDVVTLSTMKRNVNAEPFMDELEELDNIITTMTDAMESMMQVQISFLYMNSIKQILAPIQHSVIQEFAKFEGIRTSFVGFLHKLTDDPNAKRFLTMQNLRERLGEMMDDLDLIRKGLKRYLDWERTSYARFFFVSDEDMFELLGKAKETESINKYMKKMFEGIKALEDNHKKVAQGVTAQGGAQGQKRQFEANFTKMISSEKEEVDFLTQVPITGELAKMMSGVEDQMKLKLQSLMFEAHQSLEQQSGVKPQEKYDKWIQEFPGQILITAAQMKWTKDCEARLNEVASAVEKNDGKGEKGKMGQGPEGGKKKPTVSLWSKYRMEFTKYIEELTRLSRRYTHELTKMKLTALMIIELHNRDIIDHISISCTSVRSFDWLKQLRFHPKETGSNNSYTALNIEQLNAPFDYGWEYQGNNGRLIVTPLTDRCYITLTQAMYMKKGGAPQGPAGTGKTETVKDLGKGMARFVFIFNCSEGLELSSLIRMFAGFAATGSWGCFDEFNRVEIEVLSVVAIEIARIFELIAIEEPKIAFEGISGINLNKNCSIFITMNPGYAGRTELPDNLKALFRPVAMMVPDMSLICKISLQSGGFSTSDSLSKKIDTLYSLMSQQFSKQSHYDFTLRAIKSVLTQASILRKESFVPEASKGKPVDSDELAESELKVLIKAIIDMNYPKFVAVDAPLFDMLMEDMFRGFDRKEYKTEKGGLREAVVKQFELKNLRLIDPIIDKVLQLYNTKATRHGNMVVGKAYSGKTTCWTVLAAALTSLAEKGVENYKKVTPFKLNPKAIDTKELYGWVDPETQQSNAGVFSSIMDSTCTRSDSPDEKWIVFDGPIDTKWIESMNSLLDDNKVLTLLDGNRINLHPLVSLLFEVDDLSEASPATVSRCGMIYMDVDDIKIRDVFESWLHKVDPGEAPVEDAMTGAVSLSLPDVLYDLWEKWVEPLLLKKNRFCQDFIETSDVHLVQNMLRFMDLMATNPSNGISYTEKQKDEMFWIKFEKFFAFSFIWSIGIVVQDEFRKYMDIQIREVENFFPFKDLVFDYYLNLEKGDWALWDERINTSTMSWKPPANLPIHRFLVETSDTIRRRFILSNLMQNLIPVLTIGVTGTGKSALINSILQGWDETNYLYLILNLSANTTSAKLQEIIESRLWKQTKTKIRPPSSKKAIIFIDDLNMPKKDLFNSQPTLELVRQYMEHGGWYDRDKRELFIDLIDTQLLCAMAPPGSGRNEISKRLSTKFHLIGFSTPADHQLRRIYQSILYYKLAEFDSEEVKPNIEAIVNLVLNIYKGMQTEEDFKPTPTKSHYIFNLRDLSRSIQGICLIDKFNCDTKGTLLRLTVHECKRQFMDRLISESDKEAFKKLCNDQLEHIFTTSYNDVMGEKDESIFFDFLDEKDDKDPMAALDAAYGGGEGKGEERQYREQQLSNLTELKTLMLNYLAGYNKEEKNPMHIVLFQMAIEYTCRINRILKLSNGHGLLIGEGGSGRHSLTKLASYLARYRTYQIKVSKEFTHAHFRNEMRALFERIVQKNQPICFLFSDNEIISEGFIEDVNNILSLGEIPNLFIKKDTRDDFAPIRDRIRKMHGTKERESDEMIFDEFISIIQKNLHVIFCISQSGSNLRTFARQYPGITSNTTQIWFTDWPKDALREVANEYLQHLSFTEEQNAGIADYFGTVHEAVVSFSHRMASELKRTYYVTPKSYIDYVNGFSSLLTSKRAEFSNQIMKLEKGLNKLTEAHESVEDLKTKMEKKRFDVQNKKKEVESVMAVIVQQSKEAENRQGKIEERSKDITAKKNECDKILKETEDKIKDASKPMEKCMEMIKNLTNRDMAVIKSIASKNNPDARILNILGAIMIIIGEESSDQNTIKSKLTDTGFLSMVVNADFDKIRDRKILKINNFTKKKEMDRDHMKNFNPEAELFWEYVLNVERYARTNCEVDPLRKDAARMRADSIKAEEELKVSKETLEILTAEITEKRKELEKYNEEYEDYKNQFAKLEERLEKAERLYSLLSSSQEIWESGKKDWMERFTKINGDILLVASYLNYVGPFPSEYRTEFLDEVLKKNMPSTKLIYSQNWVFNTFLANEAEIIDWQFDGLPSDPFSSENGVLVTKSSRYPLMIDPQRQAYEWIRRMESKEGRTLHIIDRASEKMMKTMESALSNGSAVLVCNVEEEIDPALEPVLNKSIKKKRTEKRGDHWVIYIGEGEVVYNPNFRLYITTQMPNPTYKPEISTKVTLINFTVKENGLEEQLLGELLQVVDDKIESERKHCIKTVAEGKVTLLSLEDKVLNKLNTIEGSLIDDENLMNILQESNDTEEKVTESMEISKQALVKVNKTRETYTYIGKIASLLYFTIYSLSGIDHMYQFSLESFKKIFIQQVEESKNKHSAANEPIKQRLAALDHALRDRVFRWACNGLFERDKILLALMLAIKLEPIDFENKKANKGQDEKGGPSKEEEEEEEEEENNEDILEGEEDKDSKPKKPREEIFAEEWDFFLKGGLVLDRENQPPNPDKDMIKERMWDNITELDKLTNFVGIVGGFTHNLKEWKRWYFSAQPEGEEGLPSDWATRIKYFSKLVLLRAIRPDRVTIGAHIYVKQTLGARFTQFPQFNIEEVYAESNARTPILFILSQGADPTYYLNQLKDQMQKTLMQISLGQGQNAKAKNQINKGQNDGLWVYLANIHLSSSFLKDLEKIIEDMENKKNRIDENFRLWLTVTPSTRFPITILQKCIKITTEPPKGIKSNMSKIFGSLVPDKYGDKRNEKKDETVGKDNMTNVTGGSKTEERVQRIKEYKKLLFGLSWFHALILERRKFLSLGWNKAYDFNDSDFLYSERIIRKMVDQNLDRVGGQSMQWEALRFLVSDINYGGKITDPFDQKLLGKYCEEFFREELIQVKDFELTKDKSLTVYRVPSDPTDDNEKPRGGRNAPQTRQTVAEVKAFYYDYVTEFFDSIDIPQIFGQHINAEVSSQIADTNRLIDSLLALQPKDAGKGSETREVILQKILDGLVPKIPQPIDYFKALERHKPIEKFPLKVVLMQEISRYNQVVRIVTETTEEMGKTLKGQTLITEEIERNLQALIENKVPSPWKSSYYSTKSLTSWITDLKERVEFFRDWAFKAQPNAFWIGAFTFPTGFTTALFQQASRKAEKPVDSFKFEFGFENKEVKSINAPRDGAYTYGYYLEGAKWDFLDMRITEADPLKLTSNMPVIHFKPVENKNLKGSKQAKSYLCPTYIYPIRTGTRENPSYMFSITLPAGPDNYGNFEETYWIKRGVALLLSISD